MGLTGSRRSRSFRFRSSASRRKRTFNLSDADFRMEDRTLLSAFTSISTPPDWVAPLSITSGPDGNIWLADDGYIGKVSPSGAVTEYHMTGPAQPDAIISGPGGNLWYIKSALGGVIGEITPAGVKTEFPLLAPGNNPSSQDPTAIAAGPDGNLWFVVDGAIGVMTPTGTVTEYPQPYPSSPYRLAGGPDGNVWFTDPYNNSIGKITPTGQVTEYTLPTAQSGPDTIVAGPDGNLWFTEIGNIGRITPSGTITEFPIPTSNSSNTAITVGPDGNLWFVESSVDQIARITTSGVITEYVLPVGPVTNPGFFGAGDHPVGIAAGSDGRMWVDDVGANGGLVAVALDPPLSSDFSFVYPNIGMTAQFADLTFTDSDQGSSPSSYSGLVTWGDGTSSPAAITASGDGVYNVGGSHTYTATGTYTITISIVDIDTSHDTGGSYLWHSLPFTATNNGVGPDGEPSSGNTLKPPAKHPKKPAPHKPTKPTHKPTKPTHKPTKTHHPAAKPTHAKTGAHGHKVTTKMAVNDGAALRASGSKLPQILIAEPAPKPVHSFWTLSRNVRHSAS
jgi:streptogramin lyase